MFGYGGIDFGASILIARAQNEQAKEGSITTATLNALAANGVMPPPPPPKAKSKKKGATA